MAANQYEIEYRRSTQHGNADALSRLVPSSADHRLDVDEYLISYVNELPVTARASATRKDPVLAHVYGSTLHGWPSVVADPMLQPYFSRKHELSVDQGCVSWGIRAVIPEAYRVRQLEDLARGYFWRPGLDSAIGEHVSVSCLCGDGEVSP